MQNDHWQVVGCWILVIIPLRNDRTMRVANDLQASFPEATCSECERFASAHGVKAAKPKLRDFLEWKNKAESILQRYNECSCIWEQSMRAAFEESEGLESFPNCALDPIIVTASDNDEDSDGISRCRADCPILCVLPGRMDFATIPCELYTKAMSYYCLQLYKGEPLTVLVDVRAGQGWPNMSIKRMLSWLRPCCSTIYSFFPGGLHRVIAYPIPNWATRLWRLVRPLLPMDVQSSMKLVSGSSTSYNAEYPKELEAYVSPSVLKLLEDQRVASFVTSP